MTNYITKTIKNGVEANIPVTSVNGQYGDVTVDSGITKIFTLSSDSDLTNAQAAFEWWANGGRPIIDYGNAEYAVSRCARQVGTSATRLVFSQCDYGMGSSRATIREMEFTITSGNVTSISRRQTGPIVESGDSGTNYVIKVSTSAPASGTASNIITFVTN